LKARERSKREVLQERLRTVEEEKSEVLSRNEEDGLLLPEIKSERFSIDLENWNGEKENRPPRILEKNKLQLSSLDLNELLPKPGGVLAKAADVRFDVPAHYRRILGIR
jgi:hypothetical protein